MGMKRAKSRSEKSASGEQSKKTANREDLFVETPISSGRFELSWTNDRLTLTDTDRSEFDGRAREIPLSTDLAIRKLSEKLLQNLVEIANFRHSNFNYLLNCNEALVVLLSALRDCFPPLKTSELLQPLVDLQSCMHDLTIGRRPGIVRYRDPLFDGGYRWLETFDKALRAGKPYPISGDRRVLTWADMQEAKLAISYDALITAYDTKSHQREHANAVMKKLLEKAKIRRFGDNNLHEIKFSEVKNWRERVGEAGRGVGRSYAVHVLRKKFGTPKSGITEPKLGNYEIRLSVAEATDFAKNMVEEVRCLQPSKHPKPDEETTEERRQHADRLGMPKSRKRTPKPA